MRRRLGVLLLALAFGLSLTACEGKDKDKDSIAVEESSTEEDYDEATPGKTKADSKAKISTFVRDGSKLGELQELTKSNVIEIKGILITSGEGRDGYPDVWSVKEQDLTRQNKYNEYYTDEYISIFVDMDKAEYVSVYTCPEKVLEDKTEISFNDLKDLAGTAGCHCLNEAIPNKELCGLIGGFDHGIDAMHLEEGLYDLFFVCEDKIYYMVQIKYMKRPVEEVQYDDSVE